MQIICYIKKLKNYSYPPKMDDFEDSVSLSKIITR